MMLRVFNDLFPGGKGAISFFSWMAFALPVSIVLFGAMAVLLARLVRPNSSDFEVDVREVADE